MSVLWLLERHARTREAKSEGRGRIEADPLTTTFRKRVRRRSRAECAIERAALDSARADTDQLCLADILAQLPREPGDDDSAEPQLALPLDAAPF